MGENNIYTSFFLGLLLNPSWLLSSREMKGTERDYSQVSRLFLQELLGWDRLLENVLGHF